MSGGYARSPAGRGVVAVVGRVILAALSAFVAEPVLAISMPELPQAPDMRIVVVSDHMIYNGVDMATYEVSSPHRLDEVLRFYREVWRGEVAESTTNIGLDTTQWTIMAHRDNEFLTTLQLHPSKQGGVYGYIAISNIFGNTVHETGRNILMPANSTVVNDITEEDMGRRSRTVVIQNEDSVNFNLDFYHQRLAADGWTEVADFSKLPAEISRPQALLMNRGDDEINLAVTRSGEKTTVVMVMVHR